MDCIPYINDLLIEIDTLERINNNNPEIDSKIQKKKQLIEECKINLSKLSEKSIEYRIYLKLLNGKTPTQAVEEVADENFMKDVKPNSHAQIWRYYKILKKNTK